MPLPKEELLQILHDHGLTSVQELTATDSGESGSAFWAAGAAGEKSIVKVLPAQQARPGAAAQVQELDATVRKLRERGYPAPRLLGSGCTGKALFWVQEVLPGAPLDSRGGMTDHAVLARILPSILKANDLQASLGTGSVQLGDLIRSTLAVGGDGYCLHATLDRDPRTRDLLALLRRTGDRHGGDIPDRSDYVHYDLNPANLLSDGSALTGVIDLNPPVMSGDRAFDLATLLFYCYDHEAFRDALRTRLLELAAPGVAATYLAHMILRQVEWSLRHRRSGTYA